MILWPQSTAIPHYGLMILRFLCTEYIYETFQEELVNCIFREIFVAATNYGYKLYPG